MKKFYLLFNLFLLINSSVNAQFVTDWSFNILGEGGAGGRFQRDKTTVDSHENVYVILGSDTSFNDYRSVIKVDEFGFLQWRKYITDELNLNPSTIISDHAGNVVAGFLKYTDPYPTHTLLLYKLSPQGDSIWTQSLPNLYSHNIYIDEDDNIFASGEHFITYNSSKTKVIKLDPDGNIVWTYIEAVASYNGLMKGIELKIDEYGNVFTLNWGGSLIKIDPDGNEVFKVDNAAFDVNFDIDSQNNIVSAGTGTDGGSQNLYFVCKYSSDGTHLWTEEFPVPNEFAYVTDVAVDEAGSVYVTGKIHHPHPINDQMIILKYSSSGNLVWDKRFDGTGDGHDMGHRLAVNDNTLYCAGKFRNNNNSDAVIMQLDTVGNVMFLDVFDAGVNLSETYCDFKFGNNGTVFAFGVIGFQDGDSFSNWDKTLVVKYNKGACPSIVTRAGNISGKVYLDNLEDCYRDTNETLLANRLVTMQGYGETHYAFTNSEGEYFFCRDTGSYLLNVSPIGHWSPTCDDTLINVDLNNNYTDLDFGVYLYDTITDVMISAAGTFFRPGDTTRIVLTYFNNGITDSVYGEIELKFDSNLTFISTDVPYYELSQGTVKWLYDDFNPGFTRVINVYVYADTSLQFGTNLTRTVASITANPLDIDLSNNVDSINQAFIAPFDPNLIEVDRDSLLLNAVTPLEYTIHFENMGNDTAFNVVVRNELPELLDITTFQMGASSFPVEIAVSGRELFFYFNGINLQPFDSSSFENKGFFKYYITTEPLTSGNFIENKAAIYFDYAAAVLTNETFNYLGHLQSGVEGDENKEEQIIVYPNPSNGVFTVQLKDASHYKGSLFNINGQTVLPVINSVSNNQMIINIAHLPPGIYFLTLLSDNKLPNTIKLVNR